MLSTNIISFELIFYLFLLDLLMMICSIMVYFGLLIVRDKGRELVEWVFDLYLSDRVNILLLSLMANMIKGSFEERRVAGCVGF